MNRHRAAQSPQRPRLRKIRLHAMEIILPRDPPLNGREIRRLRVSRAPGERKENTEKREKYRTHRVEPPKIKRE
jgi:hypothetical protein